MRRYWFYVKNYVLEFSSNLYIFRPPESEKNGYYKSVCLSPVCGYDTLNRVIGLD